MGYSGLENRRSGDEPDGSSILLLAAKVLGEVGIGKPTCLLNSSRESACGSDSHSHRQSSGVTRIRLAARVCKTRSPSETF